MSSFLGALLFVAVVAVLVWLFHPDVRRERSFATELKSRESLDDEEFCCRFFPINDSRRPVAARVRRIYAEEFGYPAEKLRLDDDFAFLLNELDAAPLVERIEREFSIVITQSDLDGAGLDCTLASMVRFVAARVTNSQAVES